MGIVGQQGLNNMSTVDQLGDMNTSTVIQN